MKIKFLLGFVLFLFAFMACQQNTQPTTKQTAKPTATILTNTAPNNSVSAMTSPAVSATAAPSVSVPDKTKIKTYDGKGVVTKINLELVSVELDHEEIKGLMPKIIMEFYVSDKKMLDKLKIGDKVSFVLEDNAGAERIIEIKKI